MFKNIKKVHFVGIGGIGMGGIAEILVNQGFIVSGSDKSLSEVTDRLESIGIKIYEGHSPENLKDADVLVYSSAVQVDNPEVQAAIDRKIPIIIVGGKLSGLGGTNARLGNGEFIVVEADEFDRTFLKLTPTIAAITTLESEHLDTYKDLDDIKTAFIEFANKVPFYGFVTLCLDEPALQDIMPHINKKIITYGFNAQADVRATDVVHKGFQSSFKIKYFNQELGDITLKIPGKHNINNSLVAVVIAKELGIDFKVIKSALESFTV